MARHSLAVLALLFAASCGYGASQPSRLSADSKPTTQSVLPGAPRVPTDRVAAEVDILETVFRRQIERGGPIPAPLEKAYFISVPKGDPSQELLARFPLGPVPVRRGSEWHQGRGVLLFVTNLKWLDDRTVEVEAGHNPSFMSASGYKYRIARKDAGWEIEKTEAQWIE